jgi:hypothetical protein
MLVSCKHARFNVVNCSEMADILVRELLDDIPNMLPVVVHMPHFATPLMPPNL